MKRMSYLVGCALALGLGLNVAFADVVTVGLTGHVISVSGNASTYVSVGQAVTATYSYDTFTPQGSDGSYLPASPPASISVVVGGQNYQTPSSWTYRITVTPVGTTPSGFDYAAFSPAGVNSELVDVSFQDFTNQWPVSAALLTGAPPLGPTVRGAIYLQPAGGGNFTAQVDSATLMPSLTISPATSSFLAQQNFDAVVLLSSGIGITSMQASVAGNSVPLSYPGTCQLAAPNSTGRSALVCPNASAVLATLGGGPIQVDWQVVQSDGSVVQQSVIWNLVL